MTKTFLTLLLCLATAALCACATTPPFSREYLAEVDPTMTPEEAVEEGIKDTQVLWGGTIISSENRSDQTIITVLYYPLDKSQRPQVEKTPASRFKIVYPGYLETMLYAPDREITVHGTLQNSMVGKVGDAPYHFAVVKADKVYLWPLRSNDSKVRFGIGVGIGVH